MHFVVSATRKDPLMLSQKKTTTKDLRNGWSTRTGGIVANRPSVFTNFNCLPFDVSLRVGVSFAGRRILRLSAIHGMHAFIRGNILHDASYRWFPPSSKVRRKRLPPSRYLGQIAVGAVRWRLNGTIRTGTVAGRHDSRLPSEHSGLVVIFR
jgi:hypothetical protein